MTEAQRLADDLYQQFMNNEWSFDTMVEASIELRRLDAVNAQLLEFAEWVLSLKTGGMIEGRARASIKAATGEKQ